MPVTQQLRHLVRHDRRTSEPDVHGVVGEHDPLVVAFLQELCQDSVTVIVHRHTDDSLEPVAVE